MKYKVVLHRSEEGVAASVPGLPGCWSPGLLQDGDTFRLGRLLLVYRSSPLRGSTKTEIGGD